MEYTAGLQERLQGAHVPQSLNCSEVNCQVQAHSDERDSLVLDMLCAVVETYYTSLPVYGGIGGGEPQGHNSTAIPRWSKGVEIYQQQSQYWNDNWVLEGDLEVTSCMG